MKKMVVVFFFLCVNLSGYSTGLTASIGMPAPVTEEEKIPLADAQDDPSATALAVKNIELKHGEHGSVLWSLSAEWGKMRRDMDLMELEKPSLTYYTPKQADQLHIQSQKGEIEQQSQIIRFVDTVRASSKGNMLSSNLMVYNGTKRALVFPHGADFTGPSAEGNAPLVEWLLDSQIIEASGGVSMTWLESADVFTHSQAKPSK